MLAIEMNDGRHYLSRVNPSFAHRIENQLKTVREVVSHQWYTTMENYFEDYPQVQFERKAHLEADFGKLLNVLTPFSCNVGRMYKKKNNQNSLKI